MKKDWSLLRSFIICRRGDNDVHHPRYWTTIVKLTVFSIIILVGLLITDLLSFAHQHSIPVVLQKTLPVKITVDFLPVTRESLPRQEKETYLRDKARVPISCLIIIRGSDGGLGNRMFLFASAYGLARLHQCQLYVAPWILNDLRTVFVVNISRMPVNLLESSAVFENRTDVFKRYSACTLYNDLLKVPLYSNYTRYEMLGFYQAYGYFDRYRDEIEEMFDFNRATINTIVPFVEKLVQAVWNITLTLPDKKYNNVTFAELKAVLRHPPPSVSPVTWIGIHIRRGDFLTFFSIDTSVSYLLSAIDYYRRKYVNCRFLIASDDKTYAKTHLGHLSDVIITPSSFFSGVDLSVLALCEHSILTAGTYGWWAAWLAGGNVLHDLNYPVPFQNCIKEHYFPPWFLFPHNSSSKGTHLPVQKAP